MLARLVIKCREDFSGAGRFLQIVVGPHFDRVNGGGNAGVAGKYDHSQMGEAFAQQGN